MNIYLIGMPGSGKTTLGKRLAEKLNQTFIDLDHHIEQKQLLFIDEIFQMYGEAKFREIETESLKDVMHLNAVISTGGGIVMKKTNKSLMNGLIIYIDTPIDIIEKRLKDSYDRPLLKEKTLEELYELRFLKYQGFADRIVSNGLDIDKALNDILKIVEKWSEQ